MSEEREQYNPVKQFIDEEKLAASSDSIDPATAPTLDKETFQANIDAFNEEMKGSDDLNQPARLIKRQSVLHLHPTQRSENHKYFEANDDDTGEPETGYYVTNSDWEDFGRPDVLTVTARPGDHLN